ncbi:MAG: membrane protein insertion efficiency factor YidD [candidate division Zixibacteria bacterium]|nr:membrane protein insertion efficiency factor YidD [candidate division Zixibacteria bacterium]
MRNWRRVLERLAVGGAIFLVRAYQTLISPLFIGGCRHWPTCSRYTIEALQLHGLQHGTMLSLRRLSHCHPGGSSGFDPVPKPERRLIS